MSQIIIRSRSLIGYIWLLIICITLTVSLVLEHDIEWEPATRTGIKLISGPPDLDSVVALFKGVLVAARLDGRMGLTLGVAALGLQGTGLLAEAVGLGFLPSSLEMAHLFLAGLADIRHFVFEHTD